MPSPAYRVITCPAVFKSGYWPYVSDLAHHCRRELPHTVHRCACGIEWHDG